MSTLNKPRSNRPAERYNVSQPPDLAGVLLPSQARSHHHVSGGNWPHNFITQVCLCCQFQISWSPVAAGHADSRLYWQLAKTINLRIMCFWVIKPNNTDPTGGSGRAALAASSHTGLPVYSLRIRLWPDFYFLSYQHSGLFCS